MDISYILGLALVTLTIATAAGFGLQRGNTVNLREQLKDCREELASIKASRDEARVANAQLTADLEALKRVVTGEVQWEVLTDSLSDHHREALEHWKQAEARFDRLIEHWTQADKRSEQLLALLHKWAEEEKRANE